MMTTSDNLPILEKGVPIPEPSRGTGIASLLREMEIGDSFLYPLPKCNGVSSTAKRIGIKLTVRVQPKTENEIQMARIWRTA